ncbi:MAG TPA: hypothetical protein VLM05_20355 [Mycobacteriales bacterium]|nr:hypothetical protein [Mycobacteriales bacterium]
MAGEGRRGRRDNGLDAAAFVPLVDVDPRVGEHLLDVLGSAGVPAYLEPSADVEPYTRTLSLPSPPTDRLFVDRDQHREAQEIVEAETPHGPRPKPQSRDDEPSHGLSDAAEEQAWQAIIAGFGPSTGMSEPGPGAPGTGSGDPEPGGPGAGAADRADESADPDLRPDTEPRPDNRPGPGGTEGWLGSLPDRTYRDRDDLIADPWSDLESDRGRRRRRGGPADTDPLPSGKDLDKAADARARYEADAAAEAEAAAEELWIDGPPTLDDGTDEHFEPPPPPPVPRPSRHAVLAGILIVLGIVFMAFPRLLGLDDGAGLTLGVISVLAGAVLLVMRLRETRADDGPDDGAIV